MEPLIFALGDEEESVWQAVVEALTQLGGERAITAVAAAKSRKAHEEHEKAIAAAAAKFPRAREEYEKARAAWHDTFRKRMVDGTLESLETDYLCASARWASWEERW